jgi:two-component system, OmpR family, sensor histidine kinase RstB
MTRLFIRFYIGVIIILFAGLCIVTFAFHNRFDTDFPRIKEKALGSSIELTKESLETSTADSFDSVLEQLRHDADYPIQVTSKDHIPAAIRQKLVTGDDVMVQVGNELAIAIPLQNRADAVWFGPIKLKYGSIETDMKIAVGAVLLLAAIAIAILLRPLARQLSLLEQTAIAFAGGNLSARVDLQRADSAKTLARAFNDMAARTEVLVRTQRELLQAVSHELRTPLARISFAIDLIRTARDSGERETRLRSLDKSAQELDELVGELLQYVRLETSGVPAAYESVELLPLVEQLIEKDSLVCEAIRFEIGPELQRGDVYVIADRNGLARVLGNLIGNAGRFARKQVVINATVSSHGTTIEVDDDGPGIPPSDRERVFEPFVRLEETGRGAGLGLALVKRIVTNHGGSVTALDNPFKGCCIRTFWPATTGAREVI